MKVHLERSDIFKVAAILGVLGLALLQENRRPLRKKLPPQESRKRIQTSAAFAVLAGATLRGFPWPHKSAAFAERCKLGLLNNAILPHKLRLILSFLLLDYQLYLSHRWSHEVPIIWRLHKTHHSDLELDTLTSLRFHSFDLMLSNLFQAFWVLVWGISPKHLSVFEVLSIHFAQLHHANVQLGKSIEESLQKVFITPHLHTIHHSILASERNSNYGIVFSLWDRLHGTFESKPVESVQVGLTKVKRPERARFLPALLLPFTSGFEE